VQSHYSNVFLALHVGLVLAAFAGFTLAAALAALYLFQERRLKRHDATILRVPAPALQTLDGLAGRTILFSLPALTLGIVVGAVRLEENGGGLDALMAVTLATWGAYGSYLALRYGYGWRGRRTAYLALGAFALVVVVRLALPATHFA
jgi:ABC-type uncharacterized transport system permease subunit